MWHIRVVRRKQINVRRKYAKNILEGGVRITGHQKPTLTSPSLFPECSDLDALNHRLPPQHSCLHKHTFLSLFPRPRNCLTMNSWWWTALVLPSWTCQVDLEKNHDCHVHIYLCYDCHCKAQNSSSKTPTMPCLFHTTASTCWIKLLNLSLWGRLVAWSHAPNCMHSDSQLWKQKLKDFKIIQFTHKLENRNIDD